MSGKEKMKKIKRTLRRAEKMSAISCWTAFIAFFSTVLPKVFIFLTNSGLRLEAGEFKYVFPLAYRLECILIGVAIVAAIVFGISLFVEDRCVNKLEEMKRR